MPALSRTSGSPVVSRDAENTNGVAPIVGRGPELAALAEALRRLETRGPAIVALSGEPGIGKTRLLDELCARADARGHLVLCGRAAELEQELPFAVVVDALGDYAASLGTAGLVRLIGNQVEELAPVAPQVDLGANGGARLHDERFRTHRAVRALLDALAVSTCVVLALDDVHWADEASLELIGYLLRRPPRRGVMLILAFRSAPALPVLTDALAGAARDNGAVWMPLDPLSRREADRLLDDELPDSARAALFAQS
jgi:predicted ATPase